MKKLLISASVFIYSLSMPLSVFALEIDPCISDSPPAGCALRDNENALGIIVGNAVNFVFGIAVLLALGFLVWGGFKWLTSGGDKEGVAGARNTIIAAIIGLILIFLSYAILNLVLVFMGYPTGIAEIIVPQIIGE